MNAAEPVEVGGLYFFAPEGRQRGPAAQYCHMPGTYSQLIMHAVFSTKRRTPWISDELANRLYPYIGGIIRGQKGSLLEIGGVADHVHLLFR